jgi:hypothetical protein
MNELAKNAERVHEDIVTMEKAKATSTKQSIASRIADEKRLTAETERERKSREAFEIAAERREAAARAQTRRDLESEVEDRINAAERATAARQKGEAEAERVRQRQLAASKKAAEDDTLAFIRGEITKEREAKRRETSLADHEIKEMARVEGERAAFRLKRAALPEPKPPQDRGLLARFFNIDDDKIAAINDRIKEFEANSNRGGFSAVRLAGNLRGLVIVGIIGFFQQLVSVAGSLASTLVALAASAGQAALALAGMAATGVAQALPVIGLLGAAWGRVGAVFKVVQQHQLALTQAAAQHTQQLGHQSQAADSVRNAHESLANAIRSEHDAENGMAKARTTAIRQLEDMNAQLRQAQLQAESATLAQSDAQRALRRAVASGDVAAQAGLSIQARSAALNVTDTRRQVSRQQADLAATGGRYQNLDVFRNAQRQLEDAKRSADQASRALKDAQQQANQVDDATVSAQRNTAALLAQLSPAERILYRALERIRATYKREFTGRGGVVEPIIAAFTHAVNEANKLLQDNRVLRSARSLAEGIGHEFKRITSFLGNDQNISFIARMSQEAKRNLPGVVTLLENLWTLFRNIADAGRSAFRRFLGFIDQVTGKAATATSSRGGLHNLERFFQRGEKYAESWLKLFGAVFNLFGALMGTAAKEGTNAVDDLTTQINKAADYLRDHAEQVRKFFEEGRKATYEVAKGVWALVKALGELYKPDQVKTLSQAFRNSLLPALTNVLKVMGALAEIFLKIAGNKVGGALVELMLTTVLLRKSLTPLVSIFSRLIVFFGTLVGSTRAVTIGLQALKAATGPYGLALAAIAATVLLLSHRWHSLKDALHDLLPVIGLLIAALVGTKGLSGAVKGVHTALTIMSTAGLSGKFGLIGTAFGKILGNVVKLIEKVPILNKLLKATAAEEAATDALGGGGPVSSTTKKRVITKTATGAEREIAPAAEGAAGASLLARYGARLKPVLRGGARAAGEAAILFEGAKSVVTGKVPFQDRADTRENRFGLSTTGGGVAQFVRKWTTDWGRINPVEKQVRKFGDTAVSSMEKFKKAGDAAGLDRLAEGAKYLATQFPKGADALNKFAEAAKASADKVRPFYNVVRDLGRQGVRKITAKDIIDPKIAGEFAGMLERLRDRAVESIKEMRSDFKFNLDLIDRGFTVGSKSWANAMKENLDVSVANIKRAMREGKISTADGTAEIDRITRQTMRKVRDNMTNMSEQGAQSLGQNMVDAANAIDDQMHRANKVTESGLARVRKLMVEGLKFYGFDEAQAIHIAKTGTLTGKKTDAGQPGRGGDAGGGFIGTKPWHRQVGGWMGKQGERGRDMLHTVLGRGEAVLNWAHQKYVEPAMQAFYGHGLDTLFTRVRGEHAGPAAGMATGGRAGGALFDGHPGNVIAGIRDLIRTMKRHFPALSVTSTTDHSKGTSTGGISDHPSGHAVDLSADEDTMSRAVSYIKRSGIVRRLKQGIHQPGLSINLGKHVPESFWGIAWDQHINHIHLALQGALGRVGDVTRRLRRMVVGGGAGALRSITQAGLDNLTAVANRRLRQAEHLSGLDASDDARGGQTSAGGKYDRTMLEDLWVRAGRALHERVGAVKRIAAAIALAESGGDPDAGHQHPYHGLWQVGPGGPWDPFENAKAAVKKYIGAGRSFTPWTTYTGYDTPGHEKTYLRFMARGGPVHAALGAARNAVLHGGEHVWTAAEVARAGGHGVMQAMRKMLGGGRQGGPSSFRDGGAVPAAYQEPTLHGVDVAGVAAQIERAQSLIRRMPSRLINAKATDRLTKSIAELTRDGGLLDQLTDAVTSHAETMARRLKLATFQVTKSGQVIRRLSPEQAAAQELFNLQKAYDDLLGNKGAISSSLADVAKRLKSSKLSTGERNRLIGVQRALNIRLGQVNQSIADNLESRYTATIDAINNRASRETARIDLAGRARDLAGSGLSALLGLATPGQLGQQRAGVLTRQANALAQTVGRRGSKDTEILDQIKDLQLQAREAIAAGIQADVDEITKAAGRRTGALDIRARVAAALGRVDDLGKIATDRIAAVSDQITALAEKRDAATRAGAGALAQDIQDQIDDLNTSITEIAAQKLSDAVDQVNNAAQRRSGQLDLQGRLADIRERAGDFRGAFAQRGDILQQRGGVIAQQRNSLYGLLAQAQAAGNQGQINSLTDQISELDVAMQENTEAIKSNTVQARQAAIDAITQRGGFLGGVFTNLQNLVQTLGATTGQVDVSALKRLTRSGGQVLSQTGAGYRNELLGYGVDVRGLSGQGLVSALSKLNYDGIEANFSTDQKTQFEDLINKIIENATAVETNTQQLKQLNGQNEQQFSSPLWQFLRVAILNGTGGVLPQYRSPGLSFMPTTQMPRPSRPGNNFGDDRGGDVIDIDIHTGGAPVTEGEALALGQKLSFIRKTRR